MPLDPQAEAMLAAARAAGMPSNEFLTVAQARANMLALVPARPLVEVGTAVDSHIPSPAGDVPVRIYTPHGTAPFPVVIYFHGGGWVLGSPATHDTVARNLCAGTGCVVLSLDYRLAPEHPFPAALDDGVAAVIWAAAHAALIGGDPDRIVVCGDSAGGNLATATALRMRDQGGPPLRGQLLIYPVTDYYLPATESYLANAEGYGLTRTGMIWFWDHYLPDRSAADLPYVSPLRSADLAGLPPALVITAGYDVLRDEGDRYAARLQAAGVPTEYSCYEGMVHGFFNRYGILDQTKVAVAQACDWLRRIVA
jgi:acetyl esterase